MKPVIVWDPPAGSDWGRSWIERMLAICNVDWSQAGKPTRDLPTFQKTIVVTNNSKAYDYIERLKEDDRSYGVILLSDECLSEPMFYLEDPNCKFAARNYFHPGYHGHPKVFVFGLGYKNGFEVNTSVRGAADRRIENREYEWTFFGSIKADRTECIKTMVQLEPYVCETFELFHDPNHLGPDPYSLACLLSKYVPCPQGGASLDSFRIYEALEAGAIPVTVKNSFGLQIDPTYWHGVFYGDTELPFICENTWRDCLKAIIKLKNSDKEEEVRHNCHVFWNKWVINWQKEFAKRIPLL